jgi:ankyrin repeat protein
VLDADDEQVRFAHPSVHQFLFKTGGHKHAFQIEYKNGQLQCAELGINYLNFSDFGLQLQTLGHNPASIAGPILASTSSTLGKVMRKAARLRPRRAANSLQTHLPTFPSSRDMSRYKFLSYAEENWVNDSKFITKESPMWSNFRSLAIQPNASRRIHPWHSDGTSYQTHFRGLLEWAVKKRHIPLLELLFHSSVGDSVREFCEQPLIEDGLPALHLAARLGYDDVVELLLSVSGVNNLDYARRTALHYAAEKGHTLVAEILLKVKGARIIESSKSAPETPLLLSAKQGHVAIMRLLLKVGAKVNVRDATRRTPLSWAAGNGHEAVVQLLTEHYDIDVNLSDESGRTPLFWAAGNGHEAVVQLLIEHYDIDVNLADDSDKTPLHWAANNEDGVVTKILLQHTNIAINYRDRSDETPFVRAIRSGREAMVKLLLERNDIDLNNENSRVAIPLFTAIGFGNENMLMLLLKRKDLNVNARNVYGNTPLF